LFDSDVTGILCWTVTDSRGEDGVNVIFQEFMVRELIADRQAEAAAARLASRGRRRRKAARQALRRKEAR